MCKGIDIGQYFPYNHFQMRTAHGKGERKMAIMLRLKCPSCGEVMNAAGFCNCTKCGTPIRYNGWGMLQIYRMGSPVSIAAGYGIYLDGQPYGHLANKESIRIPLPMGTHTLHMTCGMTRRCEDLTFTLTPEAPAAYVKASIRMGFWSNTIRLTPADPSEMPQA